MMIAFPAIGSSRLASRTEAAFPISFPERRATSAQAHSAGTIPRIRIPNTSLKRSDPFAAVFLFRIFLSAIQLSEFIYSPRDGENPSEEGVEI